MMMASDEHKRLAGIIKGVHSDLRRQFQACKEDESFADSLWDEHCKQVDVLSNYAVAMHNLADIHWRQNNSSSRIDWCHNTITNYFYNGGMKKCLQKDYKWKMKMDINESSHLIEDNIIERRCMIESISSNKLKLLDVGSCYNPFSAYEEYSTLAVDLCPATPCVYKCDFMKVEVLQVREEDTSTYFAKLASPVLFLPTSTFHIVVFSLFLEYLPLKNQRLHCCKKAAELLVDNGLFLIITPDSKHQNYNAKMMKSWNLTLESLGLKRVTYVKQKHLHCLAFRKMPKQFRDRLCQTNPEELGGGLYIPQDFHDFTSLTLADSRTHSDGVHDSEQIKRNFTINRKCKEHPSHATRLSAIWRIRPKMLNEMTTAEERQAKEQLVFGDKQFQHQQEKFKRIAWLHRNNEENYL